MARPVTVTAFGNAQVDTSQSQFGGASLLLDGSGDQLRTSNKVVPLTSDFTIEGWVYPASTGTRYDLFAQFNPNSVEGRTFCNTITSNQFQAFIGNSSGNMIITSTATHSADRFYHYAFVRQGDVFRLFIDGNLEGTNTVANIAVVDTPLNIGLREGFTTDTAGNIDEFRVSNVARYTVNFTPQTSPHVNDANTLLLLHMDGTDGSTTFIDDTGGVKEFNADLTVTATIVATPNRMRYAGADLTVTASNSTTTNRTRGFDTSFTSAFSPTVNVSAQKTVETVMQVSAVMSVDIDSIRDSSATLQNIVNLNAQAVKTADVESTPNITCTIEAATGRIRNADAAFASTTALVIVATRVIPGAANIQSANQLAVSAVRTRNSQASVNANTSMSATPIRIREFAASLDVDIFLTADDENKDSRAALTVNSSIQINTNVTYASAALINVTTTVQTLANAKKVFDATLASTFTMSATGRRVVYDDIVYVIPNENTLHQINNETRAYVIGDE